MRASRLAGFVAVLVLLPVLLGAVGDGCSVASKSPAPNVSGWWDITYDDVIDVEVRVGGAVYTDQLGAQGGTISINHEGTPLSFDLDCTRPEVVCPSEAWPTRVLAEQRDAVYQHQMIVTLPTQHCAGQLVAADPAACGVGTRNPDCDDVCDGDVTVTDDERFGVIGETGDSFRLYLGAGIATNGFNCALLGWSVADATLESTGRNTADWEATAMTAGTVEIGYAGGCLWAGDPNMDGQLEALVIGASIKFTTGFTGARTP